MKESELKEAFGSILSHEKFTPHICAIAELIYTDELDRSGLDEILRDFKIVSIEKIKLEILDLLLLYISLVLKDFNISEGEQKNMALLKRFFKIKEGDFLEYRKNEIKAIIAQQLEIMYLDGIVDSAEALNKANLQGLFDLSYDQFLQFTDEGVRQALKRGADIANLDTVKYPKC